MEPRFGTSGLRGKVTELTDDLIARYAHAFFSACDLGSGIMVARDLRPSSSRICDTLVRSALDVGLNVTDCGEIPTPALAFMAQAAGTAAIMVTGSHIPADRNGLKFYVPQGEITKRDEEKITAALGATFASGKTGVLTEGTGAGEVWLARYVSAFGPSALSGLRVGVWSHSAVSRDLLLALLERLGATAIELGRSDTFMALDTEAVPEIWRDRIKEWVDASSLDALISTDGDGDRPLIADENGTVIPGDVIGQITAQAVGATAVATPVTSNSGVEGSARFAAVARTSVGSPHVIRAMQGLSGRVIGYEANGGFMLGFEAALSKGKLAALATRDSFLPIVAVLSEGRSKGSVARRVAEEPATRVVADRLEDVAPAASHSILGALTGDPGVRRVLFSHLGLVEAAFATGDGILLAATCGTTIRLRPSGNAPELRVYVESGTETAANGLKDRMIAWLAERLGKEN